MEEIIEKEDFIRSVRASFPLDVIKAIQGYAPPIRLSSVLRTITLWAILKSKENGNSLYLSFSEVVDWIKIAYQEYLTEREKDLLTMRGFDPLL